MSQRQQSVPSAPTFDEYENPDAILSVKSRPPPMYDDVVQEVERSVRDVEKAGAAKKRGCKSRTKIVLKVGLTLILVTTFVLTVFTTMSLVSMKSSYSMYIGMADDIWKIQNDRREMSLDISRLEGEVAKNAEDIRETQNDRLEMSSDISRLEGEVGRNYRVISRIEGEVAKISETVYSHHTTTTTRPPRRHYYNIWR